MALHVVAFIASLATFAKTQSARRIPRSRSHRRIKVNVETVEDYADEVPTEVSSDEVPEAPVKTFGFDLDRGSKI